MKNEYFAQEILEAFNDKKLKEFNLKIFVYYSNIKELIIPNDVPSYKCIIIKYLNKKQKKEIKK